MTSRDASTRLVRDALRMLGVKRLLFAIHDASFPSDPDENIGRGSPGTRASARLFAFVERLGFTGIQLGPQGQTSRSNPSPYDGTAFSRNVASIPLVMFDSGIVSGCIAEASLAQAIAPAAERVDHARAVDTTHRLVTEAHESLCRAPRASVTTAVDAFRSAHADWLERDALYSAISKEHGGASYRFWPSDGDLFARPPTHADAHRAALAIRHRAALDRYAFGQLLAHEAHAMVRERAEAHGLTLHADLQAGLSETDTWAWRALFLDGYAMGAPPSRTTTAGQPWGYPVLDPEQLYASAARAAGGPALQFLALRFEKTLAEYDGVRIDHPHALVCPWVYRTDDADREAAVRRGARLFESPDLPDHPMLARYAIARPSQIDRAQARYADGWVRDLEPDQIDRYAVAIDLLLETARRHGRPVSAIACEVLSTMPRPLGLVLERAGLGRFRVVQKARLDDPNDVYRPDTAKRADWMMLGTHDTPSIWAVTRSFSDEAREKWADHLAGQLALRDGVRSRLARDPDALAHAMLAEILSCPAENVMVFFADLFGCVERYNEPGTTGPDNWSLRLPASFEQLYEERAARRAALDLPLSLAMALESRDFGEEGRTLSSALYAVSASGGLGAEGDDARPGERGRVTER